MVAPCQALLSQQVPYFFCHVVPYYKIPHPGETPCKNSHYSTEKNPLPSAVKLTWQTSNEALAKLNILTDLSKSYSVKASSLNWRERDQKKRVLTYPLSLLPTLH